MDIPVLFLIFNRPETERRVFEMIRKAKPKILFVAADGPRLNKEGEKDKCALARKIIDEGIDWDCTVHKLYRKENLGCKIAVSSAINWFFENVEEGIILEDDCLPDITFFEYCSVMLEKYRNVDRIMHVGGNNFQNGIKRGDASYYFSKYPHIWGWATWRRAWKKYNINLSDLKYDFDNLFDSRTGFLEKIFWYSNFSVVSKGLIDTWDYQWVYAIFKNRGLCINPNTNLVLNIGIGLDSTHTKKSNKTIQGVKMGNFKKSDNAISIKVDKNADEFVLNNVFDVRISKIFNILLIYPSFIVKKFLHR